MLRKSLLLIMLSFLLYSCAEPTSIDEQLNNLTSPVVVVTVGSGCNSCTPQVKVRDGNGQLVTIRDHSLESAKPGDTLR